MAAPQSDRAALAQEFVRVVKSRGFKVVAFDMDQTLCRIHSRGSLTKDQLPGYIACVTEDFKQVVPLLVREGIRLAVATHSDRAEYAHLGRDPEVYLLGEDLVEPVLSATVPDHAPHFFVFAWNPDARVGEGTGHLPENSGKKLHIRTISEHYGIPTKEILLLDDDPNNARDTDGQFHTFHVNENIGFDIQDFLARFE